MYRHSPQSHTHICFFELREFHYLVTALLHILSSISTIESLNCCMNELKYIYHISLFRTWIINFVAYSCTHTCSLSYIAAHTHGNMYIQTGTGQRDPHTYEVHDLYAEWLIYFCIINSVLHKIGKRGY